MRSFYTKDEARTFASTLRKSFGMESARVLDSAVNTAKDTDRFDIFLSHASRDAELILGVRGLLESFGFAVYVDWIDDKELDHSEVDRDNADLLRRRMRQSGSLVWVATEAASESKWMPWELGYFDGYRPSQVAILPLVDRPGQLFKGQEYLALYPVIDKDKYLQGGEDIFVEDIGHQWTTLKKFGKGASDWKRYRKL